MAVLRPRTKLIWIRLSTKEFEDFNQICRGSGARSVSELGRTALQKMIAEAGQPDIVEKRILELDERLAEVSGRLQQLCQMLAVNLNLREPDAPHGERSKQVGVTE